jgi:glc operon protein GlcG
MAHDLHPPGPPGTVSLEAARAAIDAAVAEARVRGIGVVVAVAAPSGDLVALARMDGVPPLAAMRKCRTVGLTWRSTASFAASLKGDLETEPEFFHGMHHVGHLMTVGGGVPILIGDRLAGAVAVSGASTEDDIALAELAAQAVVDHR